jgi:hypothetical protein
LTLQDREQDRIELLALAAAASSRISQHSSNRLGGAEQMASKPRGFCFEGTADLLVHFLASPLNGLSGTSFVAAGPASPVKRKWTKRSRPVQAQLWNE